ncbi:MAG: hypothetical protein ACI9XB_004905 [Gammaproteobacteria bacterium]|jgi:hypothetical protein
MARKSRIPYILDPGIYPTFPKAIIRAADDMIVSEGRTLLGKVLKGSKDKKLLARELDKKTFLRSLLRHYHQRNWSPSRLGHTRRLSAHCVRRSISDGGAFP